MRQRYAVTVVVLLLALAGPAAAQPFTDAPAPAWVAAALAKLAADGLVQGYPDGTFRGDRALTRYETAAVVARVLARIESRQPQAPAASAPAPGQPQVTKEDLDLLLRLVAELRTELADKDVRVPAAEQELQAIKARLDNVRITGQFRYREDVERSTSGVGVPVNGNPLTSATDAGAGAFGNRSAYLFKLAFDGAVTDDIHFIAAVWTQGGVQTFNSGQFGVPDDTINAGAGQSTGFNGGFGSIDSAFLDWKNAWGSPLDIWLGRFGADPQPGPCSAACYPIQFGPFGLLMNDTGATWSDSTSDSGVNLADGLRLALRLPNLADLQAQAVLIRVAGGGGVPVAPISGDAYLFGEDAYGVDVNVQAADGTRVGAYDVGTEITPAANTPGPGGFGNAAQWHTYGPGGGSMNPGNLGSLGPSTYHCVPTAGGITCPAAGTGWGAYVQSDLLHGVHLDGEYAQWNDAVFQTNDQGYQLNLTWDLGALAHAGHGWTLQTGFVHYGQNFYPPYGAAEADAALNDTIYPGNAQGVTATMSINPVDEWTLYVNYFGGSSASNGQALAEYEVGAQYAFAQQAQLWFLVRELRIAGIEQFLLYRAQIDYNF